MSAEDRKKVEYLVSVLLEPTIRYSPYKSHNIAWILEEIAGCSISKAEMESIMEAAGYTPNSKPVYYNYLGKNFKSYGTRYKARFRTDVGKVRFKSGVTNTKIVWKGDEVWFPEIHRPRLYDEG